MPTLPGVPKCPVHGQPADNFEGTGLRLQLPLHYQVQAPQLGRGMLERKHDCEWHKWEHVQGKPPTTAGGPGPKGSAWFPPFAFFQLMPCVFWGVALRSWNDNACGRAFPFVSRSPHWPWTEAAGAAHTPLHFGSPLQLCRGRAARTWHGLGEPWSCLDPQPVPGCRIPPGSVVGMNLALSGDRSYIQQQRSPPSPSLALDFRPTITAC